MSDVKFRATVKHDGAEVGDLPWLEEFWAVRYGDYSALQDRIEELEAKLEAAIELLGDWRLASSGYLSVQAAINKHDAALALMEDTDDE